MEASSMHVLFVAPEFPHYQRQFVRALHAVGARVTGIGERPAGALGEIGGWLHRYIQVPSVCHVPSLVQAVKSAQAESWVDRLEATVEAHVMAAAEAREAAGIPGLTVRQAVLCRDKPTMKEFLRERGIPCAASTGANDEADVRAFVALHGYPIIIKPRDGAGAAGTFRVDSDEQLPGVLRASGLLDGAHVAVEEFIEGHEGFYDTLCIGGDIALDFVSHYYPGVLAAMRDRRVSPTIVATNRMAAEGYDEVKDLGARVVRELGLGTTATHMEWFFGPKGLKFSEIGARPPGVGQWDLYAAGNEFDLYRQWAMAIAHGRLDQRPSRRYAAGIVNLRPDRDGRIRGYEGVDVLQHRFGEWVIDAHLPPAGTPTQGVEAGYMANAWVRMKHPDYDVLRAMLDEVGRTLKVRAA
jgi:carbamoylphosphate synthase large subunit